VMFNSQIMGILWKIISAVFRGYDLQHAVECFYNMVEHFHIFRDLMEFLKGDYEGRWIRRGQVVCPIQSSDLNTLHFVLWDCI